MGDVVFGVESRGPLRIHAEPSPMSDTRLGRSGTMWVSCDKADDGWGFTVHVRRL